MGYLTKEIFEKPTLFSILSIVGIIVGVPFGIYGLTLKGGESLGGTLILVGVFILIIILAIDRGLVSKIKPVKLSIFELLFATVCLTIYQFNERKIIVDLENYKENYFVLIYNNGSLKNSKITNQILFNKECQIEQNFVVIPQTLKSEYQIEVLSPKNWESLEERPDSIEGCNIEFYNSEDKEFNQEDINSIVKKIIKNYHR